jgi:hypothetical protein
MRHKFSTFVRTIFGILLIPILVANVEGACPPGPRLVCGEYFNSAAGVIARLDSIKHVQPPNEMDYFLYRLTTTKSLRGHIPTDFTIWEENSSGRAPFSWSRGTSYLLFLDRLQGSKFYDLDGCGNSAPMSSASKTLNEIAALQNQKDALIDASVGGDSDFWQGGPVVIVAERTDGKRITAKTKRNGHARFHVPPGVYRVFPLPKKDFELALFSYDDPRHVTAVDGSCAQVVFERKPDGP